VLLSGGDTGTRITAADWPEHGTRTITRTTGGTFAGGAGDREFDAGAAGGHVVAGISG
jgi:hypothetical protein